MSLRIMLIHAIARACRASDGKVKIARQELQVPRSNKPGSNGAGGVAWILRCLTPIPGRFPNSDWRPCGSPGRPPYRCSTRLSIFGPDHNRLGSRYVAGDSTPGRSRVELMRMFVVGGRNRLRSPTAEAVWAKYRGVETVSAWTSADAGNPLFRPGRMGGCGFRDGEGSSETAQ